jgi:transglutaminase-like putative cysteine protease
MTSHRMHHLLTHLSLALAGTCLTCAEMSYLPEMVLILPVYLGLIALSWWRGQRKSLPAWLANMLALVIVGSMVVWMLARSNQSGDNWRRDVPLAVLLIPHLGPALMALLVVRMFRPPALIDFWLFQGLGLLQVALGCVLASGMLFAISLVAYLFVAGCAVACHERHVQGRSGQALVTKDGEEAPNPSTMLLLPRRDESRGASWLMFGLRWSPAVIVPVGVLYVLTPRIEGPEWDPLARFGVNPPNISMQTGFADELDMTRTGRVENDTSPAFSVRVENRDGRPVSGLPAGQRFRGLIFDRYVHGRWRVSTVLKGLWKAPPSPPSPLAVERSDVLFLKFHIPQEAGGVFLAEPVLPGPRPDVLPFVLNDTDSVRDLPFFEPPGAGTIMPRPFFLQSQYRYVQTFVVGTSRERYPAVRVSDKYLMDLLSSPNPRLVSWSLDLLKQMDQERFPDAPRLLPLLEKMREPGAALPLMYYESVARLFSEYLSHSGEYAWSPEIRREGRGDPIEDFLFHVKQGPCERFASGLALLLRAYKIPARMVRGFRGAEYQGDGTYVVFNHYAHAWVEVLVSSQTGPGNDWLTLDPSPPDAVPSTTALVKLQRTSQAFWRDLIMGYNSGEQMNLWDDLVSGRLLESLFPWLGLAGVLGALAWAVLRHKPRVPRSRTHTLYDRMLSVLAGHIPPGPGSSETPVEVAERAAAVLSARPATVTLADVPAQVVTLHYAMRFGGHTPDAASIHVVAGRLEALSVALRQA